MCFEMGALEVGLAAFRVWADVVPHAGILHQEFDTMDQWDKPSWRRGDGCQPGASWGHHRRLDRACRPGNQEHEGAAGRLTFHKENVRAHHGLRARGHHWFAETGAGLLSCVD